MSFELLEDENARLEVALSVSQQTIRALHDSLKTHDTDYLVVSEENEKLRCEMTKMEKENIKLRKNLDIEKKGRSSLQEQVFRFRKKRDQMVKEKEALVVENCRLASENSAFKKQLKSYDKDAEILMLQQELEEMQKKFETIVVYEKYKKKIHNWEVYLKSEFESSDTSE